MITEQAKIEYRLALPNILLKGLIESTIELETAKRALTYYQSLKDTTPGQIEVCKNVIESKFVAQQKIFEHALDLMIKGVKCCEIEVKEKDQEIAKLQTAIAEIQKQIDLLSNCDPATTL